MEHRRRMVLQRDILCRYLTDVDQLVDNGGAVLKQALEIAPDIPYIVIAGSPC